LLAVAILLSMGLWLYVYSPPAKPEVVPPVTDYDVTGMRQAVSPESIRNQIDEIAACGSRFMGQEGFGKVQELIRRKFDAADLRVYEQRIKTVAPVTLQREIRDASGALMEGVEIYPLLPNHVQPAVTDPNGTTGVLVKVTDELLRERDRFDDAIALVDTDDLPELKLSWARYAQLGFRALIVSHSEGIEQIRWDRSKEIGELIGNAPVNYVRVVATQGVFEHVGELVTLHVSGRWKPIDNINFVGVMTAGDDRDALAGADEALIITAHYDAMSPLPDLAAGTMQATELATLLGLLEGLSEHRSALRRDVIFVVTGARMMQQIGLVRLASILGTGQDKGMGRRATESALSEHEEMLAKVETILAKFDDPSFCVDAEATGQAVSEMDSGVESFLRTQVRYLLNARLLDSSEPMLQRKLDFLRIGERIDSDEYEAFMAAKAIYDDYLMVAGYPLEKLLRTLAEHEELGERMGFREMARERFAELRDYHQREVEEGRKALKINEQFAAYKQTVGLTPLFVPDMTAKGAGDGEVTTFTLRHKDFNVEKGPSVDEILYRISQGKAYRKGFEYIPLSVDHNRKVAPPIAGTRSSAEFWTNYGYTDFQLINQDRLSSYAYASSPVELPGMRNTETLRHSLRLAGDAALSIAYGNGRFSSSPKFHPRLYSGRVYVAGVGRSMVPNFPLRDAMIAAKGKGQPYKNGAWSSFYFWTDPYGRYRLPLYLGGLKLGSVRKGENPEAVAWDERGLIKFFKDEGPQGQGVYRSIGLSSTDIANANVVVFRAAPTAVLDLVNPQTFRKYTKVKWLTAEGLAPFQKHNVFDEAVGLIMNFLPPDERFYVEFQRGTEDNENAGITAAFMLNTPEGFEEDPMVQRDIQGPGYLTADHPIVLDVPMESARSMLWVNGKRIELQDRYHMVDRRTKEFHEQAREKLDEAGEPDLSHLDRMLAARESVTYSSLNHPVIRENISEAVWSILWYLCLLVPFVFFFEKLVFGFSDIRQQLAANSAIFLAAFGLLWLLHPAFQMIRSSLMILLGFIIILISTGITILFSGKFQENLESLRASRGQVSAAEVNTMGVVGTAFMLGLNNMHRRKVRTGLTCGTLVLITFAMICFTSIRSDVVDTQTAVGKAPYQGLLVKDENLRPISPEQLHALHTAYGHRFVVAERGMVLGVQEENSNRLVRPTLNISVAGRSGEAPLQFDSAMVFDPHEPLAGEIEFVTKNGWFDANEPKDAPRPVILPNTMAQNLGITPAMVDAGDVDVVINGRSFRVHSLFNATAFLALRDLDGQSVLPFDIETITNPQKDKQSNVLAVEPFGLVHPESIVLATDLSGMEFGPGHRQGETNKVRQTSVAIWLVDPETGEPLDYSDASREINDFLQQSGRTTFYGLDGVAYRGKRAREASLTGAVDMLIPLVIAALTVLNTIKGSVYERRSEIFVYNAVGIAPRFVFFMFFAEAFVYAVVGSVLGYFLSQGTGRMLTELELTGGLNMTFTSLNTVLASLAITASVFLSTLFPALSAMEIAAPAEESGWTIPEPEGDVMEMMLPFTFDPRDRLAVLEFFERFFLDHGEGSSGRFFCASPEMGLHEQLDPLDDEGYIPRLSTTLWIKPFDLGVSQRLEIAMPVDPDTSEYIARLTLTRLSGTRESWVRLNNGFLKTVRKHFLHWRAVGPTQRTNMFDQARARLEQELAVQGAVNG
jgi:hypothetical protein